MSFSCFLQDSGNNQVVFMQLDLGSLKSVRSFAENFLKSEPQLDILINNAGLAVHCNFMSYEQRTVSVSVVIGYYIYILINIFISTV